MLFRSGQLTAEAAKNIRAWLIEPRYADYAPQVAEHIDGARWKELDDVFWTVIPFGTGGRRGKMYPIGCNAINDRTIGESAQGLADYVRETLTSAASFSCAIAYDTRHQSNHFARLCAEIMVAAGFTVYFLDGVRSTPELSFAVREKACACGIMVTASHNPPSDNAVKVYWSTGGQVLPPHDAGVIQRVMQVQDIEQTPFAEALERHGEEHLRSQVLAGGYRLHDGPDDGRPAVTIVTTGVMAVTREDTSAFSEVETGLLEAISDQLGLAIRHTQLFDELRRGSQHDDLTGLGNRRLLRIRLEDELHRAERFGQAVSILAIDIDYFKALNDRHGHPTGDASLRKLAGLMTRNLRRIDTIARIGGEEFVVLLPRTKLSEAGQVAEKLRSIVERTEFPGGDGQPDGMLLQAKSAFALARSCSSRPHISGSISGLSPVIRIITSAPRALAAPA